MARCRGALRRAMAVTVLGALVGCGAIRAGDSDTSVPDGDGGVLPVLDGTMVVLAAASLGEVMEPLAGVFEEAHPGVRVVLSADGSSRLATQLVEGAPADAFVAADEESVDRVSGAGLGASAPAVVATSSLAILVAAGNPLGISGLADLTGEVRVALCHREVPCGRYADRAFQRAGLPRPPAGAEESVQGVLTKVRLGEADAGIVYTTDVQRATDLEGVAVPPEHQVRARYLALALRDGPNPAAGAAFVEFLAGPVAQAILRDAGFGAP